MKRSGFLKRSGKWSGKPAAARRQARSRARFARAYGCVGRVQWLRGLDCCVGPCLEWPCEAVHVKSRGAGGTADDLVPMCPMHHRQLHALGIKTFLAKYRGLDLEAIAARYAFDWRKFAA